MTALTPADVVGSRFEVLDLAGVGGMGEVYRARDTTSGELVALKVMRTGASHLLERFDREARVLAQLRHPGIVRYVAHGELERGGLFLVMEWLDGIDLGARLSSGPLSIADCLYLAAQTAAALAAAHARLVVHRDIKPSNLFLPRSDVRATKILDFGVARLEIERDRLTDTGDVMGTPRYMAPEQWRASPEIDSRADVFSMGVVLYECVTGVSPYRGSTPAAILGEMLDSKVTAPSSHRADVPAALDALILRMLATDRTQRFADGAAVLAALLEIGDLQQAGQLTTAHSELTSAEQHVETIVVIGMPEQSDNTTLDVAPLAERPRETATNIATHTRTRKVIHAIVQAHGGRLVRSADGVQLAIIADQRVATDQATRAARCALALRRLLPATPMAILTGRGISRPVAAAQLVAEGAELARSACSDRDELAIGLDGVTAGLLPGRFEVSGRDGKLALTAELDADETARLLLGRPAPFVGRDREFRVLIDTFDECVREGLARAVLVAAPAGMGKSRLRLELVERLHHCNEPVQVWLGRGDPSRLGSPYAVIGNAIRRVCGLLVGDPLAVQIDKLRARVGRSMPEPHGSRVAAFLGEMVGVPFPDHSSEELRVARRDPSAMSDGIRRAWEDWLAVETRAVPVLLVLEDLHWGDAFSVKLVESAIRREQPLMVLALARPEIREAFPGMWVGEGRQELHLGKLSRKASAALAHEVLRATDATNPATTEAIERLVELSAGHPLYLEELIRQVAEGRGEGPPETVMAMVQARLEGMEPEARRVLRAASIFGEVFWTDGVAALVGEALGASRLHDWLDELAEREVFERRGSSQLRRQEEWAFRHALVRDAAYAMLTDDDRVLGHRLAGHWMEGAGEQNHAVLAQHFELGNDWDRAATHLEEANRLAIRAEAMEEAERYFEQVMRIFPKLHEDDALRRRRIDLVLAQLPAVLTLLRFPRYKEILVEHEPMAVALGDPARLGTLLSRLGESLWAVSRHREAIGFLERGVALCEAASAHEEAAYGYQAWAFSHVWLGNYEHALDGVAKVERHVRVAPHARWHVYGLGAGATAYLGLARWDDAIAIAQRGLAIAQASKEPGVISFASWMLAFAHASGGSEDDAIRYAELSHDAALTPGDQIWSECALAVALCRKGEPAQTIEILSPLLPMMRAAEFSGGELFGSALVEAHIALGQYAEARTAAQAMLDLASAHDMRPNALLARRMLAEVGFHEGADLGELQRVLDSCIAELEQLASPHQLALARIARARVAERAGRLDEAAQDVARAVASMDQLRSPWRPSDLSAFVERLGLAARA